MVISVRNMQTCWWIIQSMVVFCSCFRTNLHFLWFFSAMLKLHWDGNIWLYLMWYDLLLAHSSSRSSWQPLHHQLSCFLSQPCSSSTLQPMQWPMLKRMYGQSLLCMSVMPICLCPLSQISSELASPKYGEVQKASKQYLCQTGLLTLCYSGELLCRHAALVKA